MRPRLRPVLIAILTLALATASVTQASLLRCEAAAAAHDHHATHDRSAMSAHDHGAPQDQTQEDASLKCRGFCIVGSGQAPAVSCAAIELIPLSVLYPPSEDFTPGRVVVLDPGIPKKSV